MTTTQTIAQTFAQDSRVKEAKAMLLDALRDHQNSIEGVRPPHPGMQAETHAILSRFEEQRAGSLIFPYLGSGFGKGPLVELADGSVKYDMIAGIGVYLMGHSNPVLVDANIDAALSDVVIHGNLLQNVDSTVLVDQLLRLANRDTHVFDHCYLTSSGVMAGENSLKIAFQKKHPANRIFAFKRNFAGRTLAFSQINDKPGLRVGLPDCFPVDHIPYFDPARPEESTEQTKQAIMDRILLHRGEHAAIIFELVQGEGGFHVGQRLFFREIMKLCRSHGIAILVDEVQTFARLETPFAFQYFGLEDLVDVLWIGKASQVCATFFRKEFAPGKGLMGQTYTSTASMVRSSLATLKHLNEGEYWGPKGKINRLARHTVNRLEAFAAETRLIEGPYGLGSMIAFTPFGGDGDKVSAFAQALFKNGVISLTAGANPTRVRFLLPYTVLDEAEIDKALEIVFSTLRSFAS